MKSTNKIDIVLPFYNDSDDDWRGVLYGYMKKEGSTDRQVVGEERYRDWENLRYWFRGVEQNCKWCNKVYLVVASESQVPDWINKENPKLKIIYHRNYVPSELLPTFNIMTIENYLCKIKDLSNNYVYCNDDYFFLNPTSKEMFFVDDLPVYRGNGVEIKKIDISGFDGTFYQILNNGMDLQLKINGKKSKWHPFEHLPVPHKKDFENKIIDKYYQDFIKANNKSRFRDKNNYSNHVFLCLYKDTMPYYNSDSYKNSRYVSVRKDIDFNDYKDKDMVCFNDTQLLSNEDFKNVKNKMIDFLEKKFPKRSSFEKIGGGEKMIKCEVTEKFTLSKFEELSNIVRKNGGSRGALFVGDVFECNEEMADYLTGNNPKHTAVVKIIEVIPEKKEADTSKVEEIKEVEETVSKPKSKKKKKAVKKGE